MSDKSFTSFLLDQEEKNQKKYSSYPTEFYSSELIPSNTHFVAGGITQKLLEEIHDEQDEWEEFFSTMFFTGILLIPLQLIFSDYLKPYDSALIEWLQENTIYTFENLSAFIVSIESVLKFMANVKYLTSVIILFYLCFDPGVAYKTTIIAGTGTYIVFILKIIIHDARPFWVNSNIKPGLCRLSFGCPSLDVFVGMLYSNYLLFCTTRARNSNDIIVLKGAEQLNFSANVAWIMIVLNVLNGIFYTILGENFFYQTLITFFYGFILIRIVIVFNKDIDYYTNGSRFINEISNTACVIAMFSVTIMSILSCLIYEIVNEDLLIPRDWLVNISTHCPNALQFSEVSIRTTFLDSTAIFHILGATFGVNLVLKNIDNPYYWFASSWTHRLIRGFIGFLINILLLYSIRIFSFDSLTANYFIYSLFYGVSAYIGYGVLPILFSKIGLTNSEYINKKQELIRKKSYQIQRDEEMRNDDDFLNKND